MQNLRTSKVLNSASGKELTEAEQEGIEIKRKYKNMEHDRKAFNDETQAQLKKQKNMIEKLQKENVQLKEELAAQNQSLNKNKNTQSQKTITNVAEQIKMIREKLEEEKYA